MTESLDILIENGLVKEKRSMNVFHQASKGSHLISHNGSVILPLQPVETGDFIHISVTSGPGRLNNGCLLELPIGMDFHFSGEGKLSVAYKKNRVCMKIPPGLPLWQLKVTQSNIMRDLDLNTSQYRRISVREIGT